jgi:tetratricopeptide (TPR) repeat protein
LEESEKLIRKALDLDKVAREKLLEEKKIDAETAKKRNAAYVDSLAWVLFKQKKYADAKKQMLEAVEDDDQSQSLEIWDHLADIHMALGEKKEAIAAWQKALRLPDQSSRDLDRRKKITAKLTKAGGKPRKED